MSDLSLLIADDHPLILRGLLDFLTEKQYRVQHTAKNGKEALALIKAHQPDIAVLDVKMPYLSGIEVAQNIQNLNLSTKVILITVEKSEMIYEQARDANVYGYILKEFALEEIENCLHTVSEGGSYFSKELLDSIEAPEISASLDLLTRSEKEILRLLADNKTTKEIAEYQSISVRTVEKHKSSIRQKLKLDSKIATLYLFANAHLKFL